MKKMKKILSVILTLAMVLGMSVTTFAAGDTPNAIIGDNDDRGTITIQGFKTIEKKSGDTTQWVLPENLKIEAYQIIKAVYANNETIEDNKGKNDGSFSGYEVIFDSDALGAGKTAIDIADQKQPTTGSTDLPEVKINEGHLTDIWNHIVDNNKDKQKDDEDYIKPVATIPVTSSNAVGYKGNVTSLASVQEFSVAVPNLPVGSYLLVITGEGKIYNPIVGSIYYDVEKNTETPPMGIENNLNNGSFSIISATNPWVKVTDNPTVEKDIVVRTTTGEAPNQQTTISNEKHGSTDIGEDIEYQVVINPIPEYGGEHPVLNIVDTLSPGLVYNATKGVEVKIYDSTASLTGSNVPNPVATLNEKDPTNTANNKDFKVTSSPSGNNTELKIDFVVNNNYTLNDTAYVGKKAVITYYATLTDAAAINQGGNENGVTLNYTRDSRVDEEDPTNPPTGTDTDKTYSYTFDIDGGAIGTHTGSETEGMLTKTGETITTSSQTTSNPLGGAVFTLYTKNPDTIMNDASITNKEEALQLAKYSNSTIVSGTTTTFDGTVTSTARGRLPIRGLAAGTTDNPAKYYLKETKAPDGYSLNTHVFEIQIAATYYVEGDTLPDNVKVGQLKSWEIKIDNETTNTFTANHAANRATVNNNGTINNVEIKNTKLASLPSTGGIGTTIFTFGGCAIMILAAALFFISRRKSAK